jgi:asparagine synthase (glutamine-hydrolysing)
MPSLKPKHLLRQIARRRLPPGLSKLPKHGFSAPIAEWMARPCAAMFEADVLQANAPVASLLDIHYVRRMFDEHRSGQRNHAQPLWTVWMLARWLQAEKARPAAAPPLTTVSKI